MLGHLGGISGSTYGKAFGTLVKRSAIGRKLKPYDLRSAITDEMRKLRIDPDVLLYVTCHEPDQRNIINAYTGIDVQGELNRYFESVKPLLAAITERAKELRIA